MNSKNLSTEQQIKRREFFSFTAFAVLSAAGIGAWTWLYKAPEEVAGITAGARRPLRQALNKTELAFRNFFSNTHLVKTYPPSMAEKKVRVNSLIGIDDKGFDASSWRLVIEREGNKNLIIPIEELKALPATDLVFTFKCVEGWDQIQHWTGIRFADFIAHYGLQKEAALDFVGMETPDGNYYIGLDRESAMHPQTILAWAMNGEVLEPEHGAPLRLIIPVKYGLKSLKRIGTMRFSNERPADYWAELGYDYYSGL